MEIKAPKQFVIIFFCMVFKLKLVLCTVSEQISTKMAFPRIPDYTKMTTSWEMVAFLFLVNPSLTINKVYSSHSCLILFICSCYGLMNYHFWLQVFSQFPPALTTFLSSYRCLVESVHFHNLKWCVDTIYITPNLDFWN